MPAVQWGFLPFSKHTQAVPRGTTIPAFHVFNDSLIQFHKRRAQATLQPGSGTQAPRSALLTAKEVDVLPSFHETVAAEEGLSTITSKL